MSEKRRDPQVNPFASRMRALKDKPSSPTNNTNSSQNQQPSSVSPSVSRSKNIFASRINEAKKANSSASATSVGLKTPAFYQIKRELHSQLLNEISPEDLAGEINEYEIKEQIGMTVNALALQRGIPLTNTQKSLIISELTDEVLGFGPLEQLLRDDQISEIMINGHKAIFVEKGGQVSRIKEMLFENEEHLLHVIRRITIRIGRRVDNSSPMVDARLPDGSRVNAVIPPLALDGSTLTIRKFPKTALLMEDLVGFGALTKSMSKFLELCVKGKLNMLVVGGTGSGKTTLLNALSAFIPNEERIITIEDAAELRLHEYIDHVVRLETRPANAEGQGQVLARDLVKNALRMRPTRIIVGECRGGETLDMLQAMNTGHEGSMSTTHANNTREALKRLEALTLMSGLDLPLKTIREMIAGTINLIVIQARFSDGSRRIKQISEITGMEGEVITTQDIFVFKQTGLNEEQKIVGHFMPTGVLPKCLPHLRSLGMEFGMELFAPDARSGNARSHAQSRAR